MGPLTVLIKPASAHCDLACKYCFYTASAASRASGVCPMMTDETARILIRRAFEARPASLTFVFQGGEPLLAGEGFYRSFTDAVKTENTLGIPVKYTVQTNGCALTDGLAELFAREDFLVGISIDGTREIHDALRTDRHGGGSYDRAAMAAELLRSRGVSVNILTVMSAEVCADGERVWESLMPHGHLQFIPYIPNDNNDLHKPSSEQLSEFLIYTFTRYADAMLRGDAVHVRDFDGYLGMLSGEPPVSCAAAGACGAYVAVEADGSAYPCDFFMDDAHVLGNISMDSIASLLSSDIMADFIGRSYRRSCGCEGCRFIGLCRGGCPRLRSEMQDFIYCEAYKSFFSRIAPVLISLSSHLRKKEK